MTFPHFDWVTLLLDGCAIPIVEVLILNTQVLHIIYRRSPHPPPAHTLTEQRPPGFKGIHEIFFCTIIISQPNKKFNYVSHCWIYTLFTIWLNEILDISCKNGAYSFESFSWFNTEINPSCVKGKKLEYDLYIYITKVFCSLYIPYTYYFFRNKCLKNLKRKIRKSYLISCVMCCLKSTIVNRYLLIYEQLKVALSFVRVRLVFV